MKTIISSKLIHSFIVVCHRNSFTGLDHNAHLHPVSRSVRSSAHICQIKFDEPSWRFEGGYRFSRPITDFSAPVRSTLYSRRPSVLRQFYRSDFDNSCIQSLRSTVYVTSTTSNSVVQSFKQLALTILCFVDELQWFSSSGIDVIRSPKF